MSALLAPLQDKIQLQQQAIQEVPQKKFLLSEQLYKVGCNGEVHDPLGFLVQIQHPK